MNYWYLKKYISAWLCVQCSHNLNYHTNKIRYPDIYQYAFHALSKQLKIGSNF